MSATAKYVFDELTLEDLMPTLRKTRTVRATQGGHHTTVYTSWELRKEYLSTSGEGETVTESYDNPELILHSDDREGPTFGIKDKIRIKNGKITAKDFNGTEYELELLERIDLDREIMSAVDNAEAAR